MSLQPLAEVSAEGLGSKPSHILVGWSPCKGPSSPFSDPSFYPKDEDSGILSPRIPHGTCARTPLIHEKMKAWRSFPGGVWIYAQRSVSPAILPPGSGQSEVALLFLRSLCWSRCQARELGTGVQAGMDVLGHWLQVQPHSSSSMSRGFSVPRCPQRSQITLLEPSRCESWKTWV